MDNKENIPEFSLEEIMAEFGSENPEAQEQEPLTEAPEAQPEEPSEEAEAQEAPVEEAEEAPEAQSVEEATEELPGEAPQAEISEEAPQELGEQFQEAFEEAAQDPVQEASGDWKGDTVRLDDLSTLVTQAEMLEEEARHQQETAEAEAPVSGETVRLESLEDLPAQELPVEEEAPEEAPKEDYQLTAEQIPAPRPILFRSRLGDLKRKLVSGPEKRYYDLAEIGLGRVQIAIFLSLLIVALCAGGTALYAMGAVMENRMRLMVFSQILAMMVSALLGCYVLMDGIVDLFTGKFSLNTMLVLTLAACAADAVFCLKELRVPCCAAFSLEMTMALWNRSLRRSTEMGQMDTLRKATSLDGLVKSKEYFGDLPGILRQEGRVEDFMDNYQAKTGPEKALNIYAIVGVLLSIGISVLAGLRHDLSLAIQVLSTSMLVAVPAGAFISQSRPAAILERRLHMVGSVICGWQGVKTLCGKAAFPLTDRDLFPLGSTKLNGVKFPGDEEPEEVIAWAAALMAANGGGLEPVFTQLRKSRGGRVCPVEELVIYPEGGIGGTIDGRALLMGTPEFLKEQGVELGDSAPVNQAVYFAADGKLVAVFAINYSRTKAAAGGLVTLGGYRKLRPVVLSSDFMVTPQLIREKFGIKPKRYQFPDREARAALSQTEVDPQLVAGALVTQQHLSGAAYAVTGARTLRNSARTGMVLHIFAGVLGLLIMAALAWLGDLQLLSPFNILLYQLLWLVPGLLVTEWTRTV